MSATKPILIVGAGLAGLSAAFHLGDREYRVLEKEARPGGLCRTEQSGAYRFDYGGHLLHLRGDDIRGLVRELMGDRLKLHQRQSAIFSSRTLTPYPFQANTFGLPPTVVRDCLLGFIEAMIAESGHQSAPDNFHDWVLTTFGEGLARHFFFPFNQKFFKLDLHEVSTDWVSWSIPRPRLREVVNGALGIQEARFGYNAEFFYPAKGGIEEVVKALAARLRRPVETGVELLEVVPAEKRAVLSTGEEVRYERLISSAPLDLFLARLRGSPPEITEAASRLRFLSVFCVNLGIEGPPLTDQHWIYVPGPEYSFHRIGVYSNFMDHGPGKNSLYLELTIPGPAAGAEGPELKEKAESAVREVGSFPIFELGRRRMEVMETMLIPRGYVIYDAYRRDRLPGLLSYLRASGIEPIGRYGRWEYSTMEDALRQGREVAEQYSCQTTGR